MNSPPTLTDSRRNMQVSCALLAWFCAGILMAIPPLATRSAVAEMGILNEALRGRWFSWYVCAFLLGAAAGGLIFGWLGDRAGRSKAMGLSVLTYSLFAGCCYFVRSPEQLLILWFLSSTGIGGVWPNGVSLASEALPGMSRPWISGLFGCSANLGLMLMAMLAWWKPITSDDWRWVMLVAATPLVLGLIILAFVPESPAWLVSRHLSGTRKSQSLVGEVFRPPLLRFTVIGILLGAIPLMGNWGSANWLVPWADQVQEQAGNTEFKAWTQWMKSGGGAVGSLLGGWMASFCGRRTAYFLFSFAAVGSSSYIFRFLSPLDDTFLLWVLIQGFFGTIYFGWLPLYLPELFPTRVRAIGTGVTFNWGRVLTAMGVLLGGQIMLTYNWNYPQIGQWTCLVYALGMVVIFFAPDTSRIKLEEQQ